MVILFAVVGVDTSALVVLVRLVVVVAVVSIVLLLLLLLLLLASYVQVDGRVVALFDLSLR